MITFLFWNLNKKPLESVVTNLVMRHEVDVLMLVECEIPPPVMLRALNQEETQFHSSVSQCDKVVIYTRFPGQFIKPVFEIPRITIRRVTLPAITEILLTVVHLPSKLHRTAEDQKRQCRWLAKEIYRVEQELVRHSRTILIGDLNMNPFEDGIVVVDGLNAVMPREIASRQTRTVDGQEYPFFYNPMWGYFGDRTIGPPGNYYYSSSGSVAFFWHIFDQVLLRPDIIPFFQHESLEILSTDGTTSFLTEKGYPDKTSVSDHLPILFRLDL